MNLPLLLRQTWTLAWKDLLVVLNSKRRITTAIRAFTFPTIFTIYFAFIIRSYWPIETYGIGAPVTVRPLANAIRDAPGGRRTLALCNYGSTDGEIDRVIQVVSDNAQGRDGQIIQVLHSYDDLLNTCRSSIGSVSTCYAAVEFHSSPESGSIWNYTIRVDGAFGVKINVKSTNNDAEIIPIPLQHAIDSAIAEVSAEKGAKPLPDNIKEYPFTSKTQKQWNDAIVTDIQNAIANYIAVVWYIAFIGLAYQAVGLQAREREGGLSQLIESMMPNPQRWERQLARLLGHWIAFTIVYFPSWIVIAVLSKIGLFRKTNPIIMIIFCVLAGFSLNSFAMLGASFFRRAQLSGICVAITVLVLGIAAQISAKTASTAAVIILGLIFTPMTFVYHMIWLAHFENKQTTPNLLHAAPGASWKVPGIVFWVIMLLQTITYPLLAALVERGLHYTDSHGRKVVYDNDSQPIVVQNFSRRYKPSWLSRLIVSLSGKRTPIVDAVTDLSLAPIQGQIMVLVGPNGSGKTSTLDAIAGLGDVSGGCITVNGSGGIGICPQKNMLWEHLTVAQHARIFNRIKSVVLSPTADAEESQLIFDCGLASKVQSMSRTLSGGQKRKLQLVMMMTGGSEVCCVDEVSSGLDPLSRKHIWDIMLNARGTRTIVLTTHFLDEAEFLADHMVIMSKGAKVAEGSVSELKHRLGDGYRFRFLHGCGYNARISDIEDLFLGLPKDQLFDQTVYTVKDDQRSVRIIKELEKREIHDYQVTGATVEEVFMKLAKDSDISIAPETVCYEPEAGIITPRPNTKEKHVNVYANNTTDEEHDSLTTGKPIGVAKQVWIFFMKRDVVLRQNYLPYAFGFFIPLIATICMSFLIKHKRYPNCSLRQQTGEADFQTLDGSSSYKPYLVVGPSSALTGASLAVFQSILPAQFGGAGSSSKNLSQYFQVVETFEEYKAAIDANFSKVSPGGFFLGQDPTYSYYSDFGFLGMYSSIFMQNIVNSILTDTTISTSLKSFDIPWTDNTSKQIQFSLYFGLVLSCYPALFALYPTRERLLRIRALQYSNGGRPFPLWLAYLMFDWINVVISSSFIIWILHDATPGSFWQLGYVFVVLIFYGLASILWSYVVSLFAKSQLAAFAVAAGSQTILLLMYFTGVMTIQSNEPPHEVKHITRIFNFTYTLIAPSANLVRALYISLNMFSSACDGSPPHIASNPGHITRFGQPILYLIGQSIVLFFILMIVDHKWTANWFKQSKSAKDSEDQRTREKEVSEEIERVTKATDGLRLKHLTRTFKDSNKGVLTAVDDLSFGIKRGEVFSIVGPNGAGKSTTIGMIRGETQPSQKGGSIHLGDIDVMKKRSTARARLGVCPQFDAVDQMTVLAHLQFYGNIRGVTDAKRNAWHIVRAVGLEQFADRKATELSGGNKRKLSLGIALMGNPELVLLDEPSSGMDPLSKRRMWDTLKKFVPGRSVLLTTHSMEEADHLANRVGVLAKSLLDIGTIDHLRRKHGHGFHIQLICKSAPQTSVEEMDALKQWVEATIPNAKQEGYSYHGQLRFNVPAEIPHTDSTVIPTQQSIGKLFVLLEEHKEELGLEFHSVSPSTFDEVFLRVLETHKIGEESASKVIKDWKYYAKLARNSLALLLLI